MTDFTSLGLSEPLTKAVTELGYKKASPVQAKAIPMVLTGRDVMVSAQTGTGKTAGFALPIMHRLSEMKAPGNQPVRALVLTPTRELAVQVAESFSRYGQHLSLKTAVAYGGVEMAPQIMALKEGVDILVATPGRLIDLLEKEHLSLNQLRILVLDEADRMLDLGFKRELDKILAAIPPKRQNLLFSATFSKDIKQLAHEFQRHPVKIEVESPNSAANTVVQSVYPVDQQDKPEILSYLIQGNQYTQALVFVRTKKAADKVADLLGDEGINATAIHSGKSQYLRNRTLIEFQAGAWRVLVATDVAARGLDIEQLPLVVNYDLPKVPEDYVHRIGRTGRAGSPGRAISLMNPEEKPLLEKIRKLIKKPLDVEPIPFFENVSGHTEEAAPAKKMKQRRAPAGQSDRKSAGRSDRKPAGRSDRKPAGRSDRKPAGQSDRKPTDNPRRGSSAPAGRSKPGQKPQQRRTPAKTGRPPQGRK
ncbi:ATP-dependent RNA helicase RhlE [Endozoicomonas sp. OPT23]|uniref:DEAD/DEAH box helicase n=1 Tax=Endozoicomonas sp. OPT23 TaxID=2072845 RepID=UPI00129BEB5F|nr:DEAD/DEAH box helicase [Endozoicomonas sp. OPT23]MRI32015.1 ATP-dependent RNA helicase RhlE [Endozoicomonas sp. OPT23]